MNGMLFGEWTFKSNWDDTEAKLSKIDGSTDYSMAVLFKGVEG